MFHRSPVGTYVLQVCTTLSCALAGAERVVEELCETLGIRPGETDPTGMFTVQPMECLGACDRAPVMMVNNDHWHEQLRPGQVRRARRG
jgi:NADH:ubiquinone oxidoreductase subunit E